MVGVKRVWKVGAALAVAGALTVGIVLAAGPGPAGPHVRSFVVRSRLAGHDLHEQAAIPAGLAPGEKRPLLVWLHGRGGYAGDIFWPQFYSELSKLGSRAPVVVALSGGDHSYWHDRRGARWGSYVMREAIPAALARLPADPRRIAIGGISMGGFGAFDLARLHPGRFCAVGGHSPAILTRSALAAPGAFDNSGDFGRHDVYAYARRTAHPYGRTPIWIDRGNRDPFVPGDRAFIAALRAHGADVTSHTWNGGHFDSYWRAHIARYLAWYAARLAAC